MKQEAAKRRNALAMANLTMAFTAEVLMGLVYKASDEKWPGGQAWKIVKGLRTRFAPDNCKS